MFYLEHRHAYHFPCAHSLRTVQISPTYYECLRDAEDAADWASICAMPDSDEDSDDEDGAGGD